MKHKKIQGFTLIELLIVIALVAILSVAVLLYINPAELLKQARDSTRISDLATLQDAIALYQSDVKGAPLGPVGTCYMASTIGTSTAGCQAYFPSASTTALSTSLALDGTGWIPIDFTKISSGNPISNLAIDPLKGDNLNYFYSYITGGGPPRFKLAARMESIVYGAGGNKDVVTKDNGVSDAMYEVGSGLGL